MGDDLIKDCLSVLYNCCICVGIFMIMSLGSVLLIFQKLPIYFQPCYIFFSILQTEGVTKSLAARDDFVMFLFTLMSNKKTFLQTATLIEDIMGVRKVISLLNEIKQLCIICIKELYPELIYKCPKSLFKTMFLGGDPTGRYSQLG